MSVSLQNELAQSTQSKAAICSLEYFQADYAK
jgi:hypothetical protein